MALVERQLVSVDWDVRTLRVVHFAVRSKGGVRIKKVLRVGIPENVVAGDPQSLGKLIRDVLDREGIGAGRMVVDAPRDQAVLNTLKLPVVGEDELPAMVEFQIARELPFPLADAVTDFAAAGSSEGAQTQDVLVAAVRHDVLSYYKRTAEVADLKLERIGLRPYANLVAVNETLGAMRHERVLFVDVGPVLTEIDVLRDGRLAFSRAASVVVPKPAPAGRDSTAGGTEGSSILDVRLAVGPAPAVPEQGRVVQALLREVTLTLEAYRADDPGADINHVVVGGDTGVEEDVLEAIRKRFDVSGERYNPTACFGWDGESGAAAGGFAAALGLALGHAAEDRLHFDFIHPKKAVPRSRRRLKKVPIAAATLLLFIGAGAVAYVQVIGPKKAQIARLQKEIDQARTDLEDDKKFRKMIEELEAWEAEQIVWLDELADLFSVWPSHDQIVLSEIDLSQKERRIELKNIDCKDSSVATDTRDRVNEVEVDGQSRFKASVGRIETRHGSYPTRTSMTIGLTERKPVKPR